MQFVIYRICHEKGLFFHSLNRDLSVLLLPTNQLAGQPPKQSWSIQFPLHFITISRFLRLLRLN